jgi:hypothetical protein
MIKVNGLKGKLRIFFDQTSPFKYATTINEFDSKGFATPRETLINSEFPQHMDVLPFSVADKPLKMKNKIKSHFIFFVF